MFKKKDRSKEYTKTLKLKILSAIDLTTEALDAFLLNLNRTCAQLGNLVIKELYASDAGFKYSNPSYFKPILKDKKNPEAGTKLVKDGDRISREIYDLSRKNFPEIASRIVSQTLNNAKSIYQAERAKILKNESNPPTLKTSKGQISLRSVDYNLKKQDDKCLISFYPFSRESERKDPLQLICWTESKHDDYVTDTLDRIFGGDYQKESLKIFPNKDGDGWFVSLSYGIPKTHLNLDGLNLKQNIMSVDLGKQYVLVIKIKTKDNTPIFTQKINGNDIDAFRNQIINRRISYQNEGRLVTTRGGHGRSRKLRPTDYLKHKERNFVQTKNHKLAQELEVLMYKYNVSDLILENLTGLQNIKKYKKLGRWPYRDLQNKIAYKAEAAGVRVHFVSPYNSSRICSNCGHLEEKFTFKFRVEHGMPLFVCSECNFKSDADENACDNFINWFIDGSRPTLSYSEWQKNKFERFAILDTRKKDIEISKEHQEVVEIVDNIKKENVAL